MKRSSSGEEEHQVSLWDNIEPWCPGQPATNRGSDGLVVVDSTQVSTTSKFDSGRSDVAN